MKPGTSHIKINIFYFFLMNLDILFMGSNNPSLGFSNNEAMPNAPSNGNSMNF